MFRLAPVLALFVFPTFMCLFPIFMCLSLRYLFLTLPFLCVTMRKKEKKKRNNNKHKQKKNDDNEQISLSQYDVSMFTASQLFESVNIPETLSQYDRKGEEEGRGQTPSL